MINSQYKIERPRDESIEEPEEESSSSESEDEEEDEEVDEAKEKEREYLEELSKKIAIILSSLVGGLFSIYLLTSFVHLKWVFELWTLQHVLTLFSLFQIESRSSQYETTVCGAPMGLVVVENKKSILASSYSKFVEFIQREHLGHLDMKQLN